jgi:hypothetical protein
METIYDNKSFYHSVQFNFTDDSKIFFKVYVDVPNKIVHFLEVDKLNAETVINLEGNKCWFNMEKSLHKEYLNTVIKDKLKAVNVEYSGYEKILYRLDGLICFWLFIYEPVRLHQIHLLHPYFLHSHYNQVKKAYRQELESLLDDLYNRSLSAKQSFINNEQIAWERFISLAEYAMEIQEKLNSIEQLMNTKL